MLGAFSRALARAQRTALLAEESNLLQRAPGLSASFATQAEAASPSQSAPKGWLADVPTTPKVLGLAGVVPFIALSPMVAEVLPLGSSIAENAALLQLGYGASIASFLGGIHWAKAMAEYGGHVQSWAADRDRYLWSITPCLLTWPLITLPAGPGAFLMALIFGGIWAVDRSFTARGLLPRWYGYSLRTPLTIGAASGLLLTAGTSLAALGSQKPASQTDRQAEDRAAR